MRMRLITIGVLLTLLGLAAPVPAAPAPSAPRVISLGDAKVKAIEVGISTKELTLIHFEMGDVAMVAVGDTSLVSVTVKGPDVLVKAIAFSGATNGFIWVAGEHTQWRFLIRDTGADARDARVVLVRDTAGGASAAKPAPAEGEKKPPVTVTDAYKPPPAPTAAPKPDHPSPKPEPPKAEPPKPAPPAAQPAPPAAPTPQLGALISVDALEGVEFALSPQVVGGQVYLNYVLRNTRSETLLAEGGRLAITNAKGARLGFTITRTGTYIGRLVPGASEVGVIQLDTPAKGFQLEWALVEIGSGAALVLRASVRLP